MNTKYFLVYVFALLIISVNATAEIYRYQDANGKWQYTDKAPSDQVKSEVIKLKGSEEAPVAEDATGEDLAEYLTKKINPRTDVEKATLAVVTVETSYGTGSGFFVTDNGFLVTNKHVVRPSSFAQIENELKQAESAVQRDVAILEDRQRELDRYKQQIDDYQKRMSAATENNKPKMLEEFNYHNNRYIDIKREHQQARKQVENSKQELADRKSGMSQSTVASTFRIVFKDGTKKQAKLVTLGKDQDLALLQIVGGYKTPFLEQVQRTGIAQGAEVFAIGSPLGFRDSVTKGIVTRHDTDRIVTDTEILPGNSGGPLITSLGGVIGVNTSVYRSNGTLGSEAFGFAIPIDVVQKEFGSYW